MITMRNRTKRMRTYNLTHEYFCVGGACSCRKTSTQQAATAPGGAQGYRTIAHRVPDVLTLIGGESRELPDAILRVPEIARDVASNILSAVTVAEPEQAGAISRTTEVRPKTRGRAR